MVNEINMDKQASPVSTISLDKNTAKQPEANVVDGVTVSTHLSQLVNLLQSENEAPSNSAVQDVKQKIQSGEYAIDYNALSDKLLNSGVLSGT